MNKNQIKPCPICGKPPQESFRPFCSKACQARDLLAWLGENYRLPDDTHSPYDNDD